MTTRSIPVAAAMALFVVGVSSVAEAGPVDVPGLVLWLDADTGNVVKDGSNNVSDWNDLLTANNTVAQNVSSLGSSDPVWLAHALGGQPAIRFTSSTNDRFSGTVDLLTPGTDRTIFVVGDGRDAGSGGTLVTLRRSTPTFVGQIAGSGNTYVYSDGVAVNIRTSTDQMPTVRAPFISAHRVNGTTLNLDVNGMSQGFSTGNTILNSENGATGFTIGGREDHAVQHWDGEIAEILVYDRELSAAERNRVGFCLQQKYGIYGSYTEEPSAVRLNELWGTGAGDKANDYDGVGNAVNLVGTTNNGGPTTLAQGSGTLPTFDFNTMPGGDRAQGSAPNGAVVVRDQKWNSVAGSPLILDFDNDQSFTDEIAQTGFGMHADAFITFDLDVIRASEGIPADMAFNLTGQVGVPDIHPRVHGARWTAAAVLLDGNLLEVFDFDDAAGTYFQVDSYNLSIPGTGRYLTFVGLVGLDLNQAGAHIGFTNVVLTAVPEPSTFVLFGLALIGLGPMLRRRRGATSR